jgi:hypothetical protein
VRPLHVEAVAFDLLTALMDSWSLWERVAGDVPLGRRWRTTSLQLITAAGTYVPYPEMVRQAAVAVDLPVERSDELLALDGAASVAGSTRHPGTFGWPPSGDGNQLLAGARGDCGPVDRRQLPARHECRAGRRVQGGSASLSGDIRRAWCTSTSSPAGRWLGTRRTRRRRPGDASLLVEPPEPRRTVGCAAADCQRTESLWSAVTPGDRTIVTLGCWDVQVRIAGSASSTSSGSTRTSSGLE